MHSHLLDTDLCVVFGETKVGGLCYSSGSSWQKGISITAYDAEGVRIYWVQEPEDRADRGV